MTRQAIIVCAILSAAQVSAQAPRPGGGTAVGQDAQSAFEVVSIKRSSRDLFPPNIDEEDPCSAALLRLTIYSSYPTGQDGGRYVSIAFKRQTMTRLGQRLSSAAQRPVVDRTGLAGEFDFILEYDENGVLRPTLVTAIREQLGLRLQPSRAPVDVLVVEQAQRPREN